MEELRAVMQTAGHQLHQSKDHHGKTPAKTGNGAVLLTDDGRKAFLTAWQNKKKEEITHPFLKENCLGLVPYVQALLLARALRGDWKCTHRFSGSEVPLCWCL